MAGFLQYIYPSDPNAVYKVSSICAKWGSVGVLIASFLRELINNYVYGGFDSSLCTDEKIKTFDVACTTYILRRRASSAFWNQASHLIVMLFGLVTCLPFFAMEDLFSGFEGAGMMRDCLLLGTVMEIMDSAFKVGVRSSSGIISTIFRPSDKGIDPYPSFIMGAGILNSSLTWVTFLRDAVLAFGVYLTCIYDHDVQAIGGTWQIVGWATVFCGVLNTVMEFLKVINFGFFDDKSNFTYYVFQLVFTVWLFIFGMHCNSLVSGEEKGMLDGDASSGSDVSDGEAPTVSASAPKEESSEEEVPKKHRKHRKAKEVSSDDDV